MDRKNADNNSQIDCFKRLASDLGLTQGLNESLDRIMGKLDLTRKPEPEPKPAKK